MLDDNSLIPIFQSYVPPIVVRRLITGPATLTEPHADRISAAVLFADITNFTSLTEKLYETGGPDELAHILNGFFEELIIVVHRHGGEVTKFAGDAIIALWPISDKLPRLGDLARTALYQAVETAATCALEIQERFPQEPIPGLEVSVEIGIGAGDVYSVHLGGVLNRWEFLLSGSPLIQMSQAIDLAGPGEIVLSNAAKEVLVDSSVIEDLPDGFGKLKARNQRDIPEERAVLHVPDDLIEALKVYVPAAILPRIEKGLCDWLSELRRVSVIFVMLPGYGASITHPFRRTLPEAQAVMHALQRALYRYGGSINKLNVDNKGITLVAAFGLPPFSQQDDAARAIHAALDMQSVLSHLGRSSAIGITTGLVYCGSIGTDNRREYTMVGRDVNMATRLMQLASERLTDGDLISEIYCDEATHSDVLSQKRSGNDLAGRIAFEREIAAYVKGFEDPISVFRPTIQPSALKSHPKKEPAEKLVGRARELLLLNSLIKGSPSGTDNNRSRLIVIEGEAGLGKSSLVKELLVSTNRLRIRALLGWANRLDQTTKYHSWMPIFREMYAISEAEALESRQSKVLAKLPYMPGERGYPALSRNLSPLLNQVLPVQFRESALTRKLSPEERDRITHDFLLRLLQIEARPRKSGYVPLRLIVIEDVQWMDPASWKLIADVLKSIASVSVLLTLRPLPAALRRQLPKLGNALISRKDTEIIRLSGLSMAELDELVVQQLDVESLSADLKQLVGDYTDGHPSLCKDLVQYWADERLIDKSIGEARFREYSDGSRVPPIPGEVIKNLIGKYDLFSPTQQMILKAASAVKPIFNSEVIAKAYPTEISNDVIDHHLSELTRLGTLKVSDGQSSGSEYSFGNQVFRQVVKEMLPVEYLIQFRSMLDKAR